MFAQNVKEIIGTCNLSLVLLVIILKKSKEYFVHISCTQRMSLIKERQVKLVAEIHRQNGIRCERGRKRNIQTMCIKCVIGNRNIVH